MQLIAGNSLRHINYNIARNGKCESQKLYVLDNQQPSSFHMEKVQRLSRKGVGKPKHCINVYNMI